MSGLTPADVGDLVGIIDPETGRPRLCRAVEVGTTAGTDNPVYWLEPVTDDTQDDPVV